MHSSLLGGCSELPVLLDGVYPSHGVFDRFIEPPGILHTGYSSADINCLCRQPGKDLVWFRNWIRHTTPQGTAMPFLDLFWLIANTAVAVREPSRSDRINSAVKVRPSNSSKGGDALNLTQEDVTSETPSQSTQASNSIATQYSQSQDLFKHDIRSLLSGRKVQPMIATCSNGFAEWIRFHMAFVTHRPSLYQQ